MSRTIIAGSFGHLLAKALAEKPLEGISPVVIGDVSPLPECAAPVVFVRHEKTERHVGRPRTLGMGYGKGKRHE